jgi:hypothetical protein
MENSLLGLFGGLALFFFAIALVFSYAWRMKDKELKEVKVAHRVVQVKPKHPDHWYKLLRRITTIIESRTPVPKTILARWLRLGTFNSAERVLVKAYEHAQVYRVFHKMIMGKHEPKVHVCQSSENDGLVVMPTHMHRQQYDRDVFIKYQDGAYYVRNAQWYNANWVRVKNLYIPESFDLTDFKNHMSKFNDTLKFGVEDGSEYVSGEAR